MTVSLNRTPPKPMKPNLTDFLAVPRASSRPAYRPSIATIGQKGAGSRGCGVVATAGPALSIACVSENVDHRVGREDQQEDGEEMQDGFEK